VWEKPVAATDSPTQHKLRNISTAYMNTGSPRIYVSRAKALSAKKGDKGYVDKNDSLAGKGAELGELRTQSFLRCLPKNWRRRL